MGFYGINGMLNDISGMFSFKVYIILGVIYPRNFWACIPGQRRKDHLHQPRVALIMLNQRKMRHPEQEMSQQVKEVQQKLLPNTPLITIHH